MSTPTSRIQSGIAYQTRPSGRPDANDRTDTASVRRERNASRREGRATTASVGHGVDGDVHTQRIALSTIRVEVLAVVAFALPAVRHVRVDADEDHKPFFLVEHTVVVNRGWPELGILTVTEPRIEGRNLRERVELIERREDRVLQRQVFDPCAGQDADEIRTDVRLEVGIPVVVD